MKYLNGIFVFVVFNEIKNEFFIVWDYLGVKLLFFFFKNDNFIFVLEIKFFFRYFLIFIKVDKEGIFEFIGFCFVRFLFLVIFKDIIEFLFVYYVIYSKNRYEIKEYW